MSVPTCVSIHANERPDAKIKCLTLSSKGIPFLAIDVTHQIFLTREQAKAIRELLWQWEIDNPETPTPQAVVDEATDKKQLAEAIDAGEPFDLPDAAHDGALAEARKRLATVGA